MTDRMYTNYPFPLLRGAIEDVYRGQGFDAAEAADGARRYVREMAPDLAAALVGREDALRAARAGLAALIGPADESPDIWVAVAGIEEAAVSQGIASGFAAAVPFVVLPKPRKGNPG